MVKLKKKMDSNWHDVMNDLLNSIERNTTTVLRNIERSFTHNNVSFSEKFRTHFLPIVNNRIIDTFDRFEIELPVRPVVSNGLKQEIKIEKLDAVLPPKPVVENLKSNPFKKRKLMNDTESKPNAFAKKLKLDVAAKDVPQPTTLNGFKFCCVHCQDETNSCESFESIADLYAHWLTLHGTRPFQFYINSLVACFHCETVGLYRNIIEHMTQNHPDDPKIIVNPKNRSYCSVCHYEGDDLDQHFANMHDIILQTNVFSAVCLPNKTLMDLLAFDVHKKKMCGYCDEVFDSKQLIAEHQSSIHGSKKAFFTEFVDNESAYLICGYCKCQIRRSKYLSHVDQSHTYEFNCTKCAFDTSKLSALIDHDKEVHHLNSLKFHCSEFMDLLKKHYFETRIVFGNGLVVNKYNLLGTKYDDSSRFVEFIEALIAEKKRLFNRSKYRNYRTSSSTEHSGASVSDDLSESSSVVDLLSSSPNTLYSELNKQNKIIKNVTIEGVKWHKDEDLCDIFEEICKRLGSSVKISDIDSVYRMHNKSDVIIVEFKDLKVKERFIYRSARVFLWNSDLRKIPQTDRKKRIYINNEMTRFYRSLWNIARKERKRGVIYSSKISKYGLEIKRTSKSKWTIILKRSELLKFLSRAKKHRGRFGVHESDF